MIFNIFRKIPWKFGSKYEAVSLLSRHTRREARDAIIINKGGAVVIQDVKDYMHEANRQLQNKIFYRQTYMDLTEKHENQRGY